MIKFLISNYSFHLIGAYLFKVMVCMNRTHFRILILGFLLNKGHISESTVGNWLNSV